MMRFNIKLSNETKEVAVEADEFVVTPNGQLEFIDRSGGAATKTAVFASGQWQYVEVI